MAEGINRYLDHAVLKPELTEAEAVEAIELGLAYKVRTVCVRPCDLDLAVGLCRGSETGVCTVLGFPHGHALSAIKAAEAQAYVAKGVAEIDMVANYGWIRSGAWDRVTADIKAVAEVTKPAGVVLKVILETGVLGLPEVARSTAGAIEAGADFVKTSTGFNGGGATEEAVAEMLKAAAGRIRVKASGGIRDAARARAFLAMGCERLGVNYASVPAICGGVVQPAGDGNY